MITYRIHNKYSLYFEFRLLSPFLGRIKGNFTKLIRDEETLLRLRKIVCVIHAEKKGSYNKTTEEGKILVLRKMIIVLKLFYCIINIETRLLIHIFMVQGRIWKCTLPSVYKILSRTHLILSFSIVSFQIGGKNDRRSGNFC